VAERLFFIDLSPQDRIAVKIVTAPPSEVTHYSLQFEARLSDSDEWTKIRRFDCSHDVVHQHFFSPDGRSTRHYEPGVSKRDGLQSALADLKANWEIYRHAYEERLSNATRRTGRT
jgi:hypothetical protein